MNKEELISYIKYKKSLPEIYDLSALDGLTLTAIRKLKKNDLRALSRKLTIKIR